jgi:hypothetical protein
MKCRLSIRLQVLDGLLKLRIASLAAVVVGNGDLYVGREPLTIDLVAIGS